MESSSDIWVSIIFGGLAFLLAGALAVVKALGLPLGAWWPAVAAVVGAIANPVRLDQPVLTRILNRQTSTATTTRESHGRSVG